MHTMTDCKGCKIKIDELGLLKSGFDECPAKETDCLKFSGKTEQAGIRAVKGICAAAPAHGFESQYNMTLEKAVGKVLCMIPKPSAHNVKKKRQGTAKKCCRINRE